MLLELQGAHGGSKLSTLLATHALRTAIEVAGGIGVAATGRVDHTARLVGRNLNELSVGIGLTASVLIKILPQNDDIPATTNVDESKAPVKGYLESFPRDFTLNSSMMAYNFTSRKDNSNSGAVRYLVEKQSAELSNVTMRPNYSDAGSGAGDNDEKPRLSPNLYEMPEEERQIPVLLVGKEGEEGGIVVG